MADDRQGFLDEYTPEDQVRCAACQETYLIEEGHECPEAPEESE